MPLLTNAIREIRAAKGWSLQKLADACQTSKSQIDKLERGQRRLTVEWMVRLAKPLGCDPRDLVGALAPTQRLPTPHGETLPVLRLTPSKEGRFLLGDEIDRLPRPFFLANTQGAYALYVQDNAMAPLFRAGQILFLNPHKPPSPGQGVLALDKDGQAMLRIFVSRKNKKIFLETAAPPVDKTTLKESDLTALHTVIGTLET